MKILCRLLTCITLLGFTDCIQPPRTAEQEKKNLVEGLQQKTVALISRDKEGESTANCSGVWVHDLLILTAAHCIKDSLFFEYQVFGDEQETKRLAKILSLDPVNDLGLLVIDSRTKPKHPIAKLSKEIWSGQHVNVMGHTIGLRWSFSEGTVSSVRKNLIIGNDNHPLLIQISSPAWLGNSGGGAFNDKGELIGICSFVVPRGPLLSFFIHSKEIEKILKDI